MISGIMPLREVDDLIDFRRDTVGDNLRSVIYYHEDGYNLQFILDDVEPLYSEEEIEEVVQDLGVNAFGKPQQERFYLHGNLNCTNRCFEEAIEMNILLSDREGIGVALDDDASPDLQTFVGECIRTIGGN